ncbi:hypothetical protein AB5I41_12220 [Sphingomonas sp. MMS24-JH45]
MKLFARAEAAPAAPAAIPLPAIYAAAPEAAPLLGATGAPWRVAAAADKADFVWDLPGGVLLRRTGDAVAQDVRTTAQLRGVLEKWETIEKPPAAPRRSPPAPDPRPRPLRRPLRTGYAGRRDGGGGEGRRRGYLTVFNLASDGTVQPLYPAAAEGEGRIEPGSACRSSPAA